MTIGQCCPQKKNRYQPKVIIETSMRQREMPHRFIPKLTCSPFDSIPLLSWIVTGTTPLGYSHIRVVVIYFVNKLI